MLKSNRLLSSRKNNRNQAAAQSQNFIMPSLVPAAAGSTGTKEALMSSDGTRARRLIGLFLLGYLLFNYPLISLFNLPALVGGIPLLYAYIFGVWVLIILLVALITSGKSKTG
jgi:hypothetical protein